MADNDSDARKLRFLPPAERDYVNLPRGIQKVFGRALNLVQMGLEPEEAKALQGFGGRQVLELVEHDESGTYRAVYTVKIAEAVYVLHAFQKKSHKGIKTDKQDVELIKERLKWAEWDAEQRRKGDRP
ncbi:MAG: type II toxin-antitoxin system RelE/ParE family toxin [Candidatus Sericytochromatia bacterium]|nr:type II toxin-antitoxin system RelE/ParE family toxin [Candidatus Sericytochromatia bacterium]